jgi:hypothetical protein
MLFNERLSNILIQFVAAILKFRRAQSTEHRAQGTEHRAQGTEHRAQGAGRIMIPNAISALP